MHGRNTDKLFLKESTRLKGRTGRALAIALSIGLTASAGRIGNMTAYADDTAAGAVNEDLQNSIAGLMSDLGVVETEIQTETEAAVQDQTFDDYKVIESSAEAVTVGDWTVSLEYTDIAYSVNAFNSVANQNTLVADDCASESIVTDGRDIYYGTGTYYSTGVYSAEYTDRTFVKYSLDTGEKTVLLTFNDAGSGYDAIGCNGKYLYIGSGVSQGASRYDDVYVLNLGDGTINRVGELADRIISAGDNLLLANPDYENGGNLYVITQDGTVLKEVKGITDAAIYNDSIWYMVQKVPYGGHVFLVGDEYNNYCKLCSCDFNGENEKDMTGWLTVEKIQDIDVASLQNTNTQETETAASENTTQLQGTNTDGAANGGSISGAADAAVSNAVSTTAADGQVTSVEGTTNGYIFPDSNTRTLTDADLADFDSGIYQQSRHDRIQQAINEIYAREGYTFSTPEILAFYQQFTWYQPFETDMTVTKAYYMNSIEQANVDFLAARL